MRKGTKTLIALAIVAALLLLAINGVKSIEKNKAVSAYKLTVIYTAEKSNGYFAHSEEYTVVLIYSGFSLVGYQTING